jgi:CheY-like chemotaxis protein
VDLGLREIDGCALLQQLRVRPTERVRTTPAVAVSPYARLDDFAAAKAAGFDYHTSKPIDANAFIAALVALARQHS